MGVIPERFDMSRMSMDTLGSLVAGARASVALVPVGSTEPHGPHLPLTTDTVISVAACSRAAEILEARNVSAVVAPPVSYGVTQCAAGFPGAVSVSGEALIGFLKAVVDGLLATRFTHVCLVNNHLEPEHDAAVRKAASGFDARAVSVASPLTRRWARTLSDEFKSGACHAGRYETSIVMAADASLVDDAACAELPEVPVSLAEQLRNGVRDFRKMGLEKAYAGAPAEASVDHGRDQIDRLGEMVAGEVMDAIGV